MKKVVALFTAMAIILSFGSICFADEIPGEVLFAESFESGNSSSIVAGSAKFTGVQLSGAVGGYRGGVTQENVQNAVTCDGLNTLGVDASSAAVLPMNGLLVNDHHLNYVKLNNEENTGGTIYAGDIVFSSVMAKLTDDSTTKTAHVVPRMGLSVNGMYGLVRATQTFVSKYPVNNSLKSTLDSKSQDFGTYASERWSWNNPP